jgi:DNA-binding protein H-NS
MATYKELLAQREALEIEIKSAMQTEKAAAIEKIRVLVAEFGLTAGDCGFSVKKEKSGKPSGNPGKRTVSVKYVGPVGETWSGRGRTPKWITGLEAQGRSRSEFLAN